ncbi:MAG: 39S ribosomal protein L45 [Ruminococcus sp.]|uniref:TIM44-like domain-containing protein n=1 Tax=Ruminococcus sp. TaxID=41978 RepID=UPI0025F61DBE|nr:TIM44-like domain-containing protein [Ruminococcus sp.]MCR5601752.1 39S ribosomal protein L45 [Ruminococcus sp.]
MKKFKKIIPVILLILSILIIPLSSRADFGDFSGDSDYGGGWDSGGSSWDSGGSSWDSGGSYSGSSSGGGSADPAEVIFILIIFAVLYIIPKITDNQKRNKHIKQMMNAPRPSCTADLRNMSSYLQTDPSFSESEFREKLSNLYVRFQNDWQAKDIHELRPYLSDSFYAQMDRQLDKYRQSNQTNRVERIAVLGVELKGWKPEYDHDVIVAVLNTRIVDYVVDDATGKVVRGSNTKEKFMKYEWTLIRSKGVKTSRSTGTTAQTCPHCGAHIDINRSTVCEYCDSVLTTDTFDWVITNIKGLSQQTR